MRVLVLAPQPFYVQRGTPIAVRHLLEALSAAGHDCDALVFPGGEEVEIPRVRVVRLPALPGLSGVGPGFSARKLAADAVMAPVAFRMAWRGRYDLVVAVEEAAFIALALRRCLGLPYLYDIDSSLPEQIDDKFGLPGWARRALVACERRAVRGAVGAMPCCRALADLVQDYAPDLPVQTLEDIPLPGAAGRGGPPAELEGAGPVVMYVGNLEGYQGVDLLLEGFARAVAEGVAARLVVVGGDAAGIAAGEAAAARLRVGERVRFLGPRPVDEIGRYLEAATVVVSPRLQGRNTPMKVYSYLASGRPLLATRLRTHTQVLDDDIAMLAEPTPEAMGRALAALLDDPALRARLAAAAATRVAAEFSPEAYRRKLTDFLETRIRPRLAGAAG